MTAKIVYTSNSAPIDESHKNIQLFEITQIPGKTKGLREFRFESFLQFPNETRIDYKGSVNVVHLKNLLLMLKQMERDGFLDNDYVE